MKYTVLIVLALFVSTFCWSQNKEISGTSYAVKTQKIDFQNLSFEELKAKAKKEKKSAFINIYMSNCIPCKDMERNVFTDIMVAEYYNPHFINASYDYTQKEGQMLSELYETNCAPTYLFIDSEGKVVHRSTGYKSQEEFVKLAEIANDPKRNMAYYEKEYPKKKFDPEFLLRYLYILDQANCAKLGEFYPAFSLSGGKSELTLKRDTVFNEYFASQKDDSLINKTNWEAIREFTYDYRSREFKYLLKNAAAFKKLYSEEAVNTKIKDVIISGRAIFLDNKPNTEANDAAYIDEIKKLNSFEAEPALFWLALYSAEASSKWDEYMRLVNEPGKKHILSAEDKQQVAETIYENVTDKTALQKAEDLMQSAVAEQPSWIMYETYANVLFHQNKKDQAKSMAQKALEIAKQAGAKKDNYNSITYLLEKIEKL